MLSTHFRGMRDMPRQSSRRKNPSIVYDVLMDSDRPLTAYQILERVRPLGLNGPPTVYRALEMLQQEGRVHRLQSINAFAVCHRNRDDQKGASFMICSTCGVADEIHDTRLETILAEWKTRAQFSTDCQTVELLGTCGKCSDTRRSKP
jgi:Fur family transcriptional regulator, zinc uptake regulator